MTSRRVCAANPANGCTNTRRRGQLMCRTCWAAIPRDIQRDVYAAYNPNAGIQNDAWLAAAQRAINSLRPKA